MNRLIGQASIMANKRVHYTVATVSDIEVPKICRNSCFYLISRGRKPISWLQFITTSNSESSEALALGAEWTLY